ncbi:hypothetical protein ES705_10742 [subsurface metagenome]
MAKTSLSLKSTVVVGLMLFICTTAMSNPTHDKPSKQYQEPNVMADKVEIVEMEGKRYQKVYMSADKLVRKFGTGLTIDKYKGYYYVELLPDIHCIADSIEIDPLVDSVKIVDSWQVIIYISKENFILKFGAQALDPDDGDYQGYYILRLPISAPYLPIYPDYPKDKSELFEKRTPYSRIFKNDDGSYTAVLTTRPTCYSVRENGEVRWVEIPPDMPITKFVRDILQTTSRDYLYNTYYGFATEKNNDGIDPYYRCVQTQNIWGVVGAGRDPTIYGFHLYQRMFTEFITTSIPPGSDIYAVEYRTYITSADPNNYDLTGTSWDEEYDWYEIWPWIRSMSLRPANYGPQYDWVSNNNGEALYDDCWDGALLYDGGGYIWDQGDGYVHAPFNSTGVSDFQDKYESGWYAIGIVDKAENNEDPDYWEGVVIAASNDRLTVNITGIEEEQTNNLQPVEFALMQNYPNPVLSKTVLKYGIPKTCKVELKLYDVTGRQVTVLVDENQKPGYYKVNWHIRNVSEKQLANGIYFYRLKAGDFVSTKKMVIVR